MFGFDLPTIISNIPALIIGFAFHEYAHGWVADRLGDPTPRSQGRLTLNPLAHLDPFGTLMALLFRFGWAKPVMINPQYFKGNKQRARLLVALAGPVTNLIIAFISMFLWFITMYFLDDSSWSSIISLVFQSIVLMNLGLGIFNLLPIPPLDGYAVLGGILPERFAPQLQQIEQYGMIILLVVLVTNVLDFILSPTVVGIFYAYEKFISFILSPLLG